ncbi:MAG TPA: hypothetical protein VFI12_10565, partial [Thermomicrobiales bacterium]|nr:hypothetical protein [Thermomicrobiales bacterium]
YSRELSDMTSLLMFTGAPAGGPAFVPTLGPFTISCASPGKTPNRNGWTAPAKKQNLGSN